MRPEIPFETIAEAFSRTAPRYDALAENNPHLTRLRDKVYAHLSRWAEPGARILELNAGTGIDAVQLARRGYSVHATDIAPAMLERIRDKARRFQLEGRITVQACSFTNLAEVEGGPYDVVFSNFGGLNCISDLGPVVSALPGVLRPGGLVTWVLLSPICLWELGLALRGQVRLATRRLARGGTLAHLEGLTFMVYYFAPGRVAAWFGRDYDRLALEGLSVITPTANSRRLALRHPRVYRVLSWLDDRLAPRWPWRGWGDFFILSMRYRPAAVG